MPKLNGVIPTNGLTFKIGTKGKASVTTDMKTVKDIEGLTPSIDGNVEEWNPMDTHGWVRRLLTGKSFSISMSGKRNYGDPGNDYVASLALVIGQEANSKFEIEFPNGDKLSFDCVVNVTTPFGGDSTAPNTLEFEVLSDGEPMYIFANAN